MSWNEGFPMKLLLAVLLATVPVAAETKILVCYFSNSGNTKKMAEALAKGVEGVEGAKAKLKSIDQVTKKDLEATDGLAVGSPVYMGDVATQVRSAFIKWSGDYGIWDSRALQDKAGAVFATGAFPSNGKEFTMWSMAQSLAQFGVVLVTPYGSMGASATTYKPDEGVDDVEAGIARDLGQRLAEIAGRLKN